MLAAAVFTAVWRARGGPAWLRLSAGICAPKCAQVYCSENLGRLAHFRGEVDHRAQDVGQYIVMGTNPHCEAGIGFA